MTQNQAIIEYIGSNGSITTYEAFINLGVTSLSSRISELSRRGFDFQRETIEQPNRYGHITRFTRYSLKEKTP